MEPDDFKQLCQELGLGEPQEEQVDEGERNPMYVEFGEHKLWYSLAESGNEWVLVPRFSGVSLDRGYREIRDRDYRIESGELVIEGVSGTKSKEFGYGRDGFNGATLRVSKDGVRVVESSSY